MVLKELQAMLILGVIEESHRKWRSPIVLVPKAGSTWLCIGFWKISTILRFDTYPMPHADKLLERLGNAEYISTLDLTKGYWQISLIAESQEKTAFPTLFGLYQFVTMPLSLHGVAATFQWLMDQCCDPTTSMQLLILTTVICSYSWEAHLQHVTMVFLALEKAGLRANPEKYHLGQREVTYCAYTVGWGWLHLLRDRLTDTINQKAGVTLPRLDQLLQAICT